MSPKVKSKVTPAKVQALRTHIEETHGKVINDNLIEDLVRMSEIVKDLRLKEVFIKPYENKDLKNDALSKQINSIRNKVQKVIQLSKDSQHALNNDQLQELHSQIEKAIQVSKTIQCQTSKLWAFGADVTKELQDVKTFLEDNYPKLRNPSNRFNF